MTDNANAACTMSVPPVAVMYQNTLPWTRIPIHMLSDGGNGYLRKKKNLVILVRTLNAVTRKDKVPGTLQQLESQFTTDVQQFGKHVFNIRHHMSSVNSVKDGRLHQMNVSYTLTFPKITVVVTQMEYKVSILERHLTKQLCIHSAQSLGSQYRSFRIGRSYHTVQTK